MKLRNVIASAVLLAPVPFVGMTEPATAAFAHIVVVSGELRVLSTAGIGGGGFDRQKQTYRKQFTLKHDSRTTRFWVSECAAAEARGELDIRVTLNADESVSVTPNLLLYEGSNCRSTDLDGQVHPASLVLPGGRGSKQVTIGVWNSEYRSDDEAWADITVTHSLWP